MYIAAGIAFVLVLAMALVIIRHNVKNGGK